MELISNEEIEQSNKLEASKIIDRFLDWYILPYFIIDSLYVEFNVCSDICGLKILREKLSDSIYKPKIELEFYIRGIWSSLSRWERYRILRDIVLDNRNIETVNDLLENIFWLDYSEYMDMIILNHIDCDWNINL